MLKKNTMKLKALINKISTYTKNNRIRIWTVFVTSLILILLSLVLAYHIRPYNSDDVSWQNALLTWHPFKHQTLYLTPDTWVANVPFYMLFSHILAPGRRVLLAEGGFFAVLNFTIYFWSGLYFIKKQHRKIDLLYLLPFLWLASFGFALANLFLNTNLRSFEIGLSILLFVAIAKIYHEEFDPMRSWLTRLATLLGCFLVGLLIYNDPYFLYLIVIPAILLLIYLYYKNRSARRSILIMAACFVISGVAYEIIHKIGTTAGIVIIPQPAIFVAYGQLFSQVATAIQSVLIIFGADITGRVVLNFVTIVYLLNLFLLAIVSFQVVKNLRLRFTDKSLEKNDSQLWMSFLAFVIVFALAVYTFSNQAINIETYRYLIIVPFVAVILLSMGIGQWSKTLRSIISIVLVISIIGNISVSVATAKGHDLILISNTDKGNYQNFDLIRALEAKGLSKGYAQYWDANINAYLSKGKLVILPIVCTPSNTSEPYDWFINASLLKKPSARTFLITDIGNVPSSPMCSSESLSLQFGTSTSSFMIDSYKVYVYNYDIASKMSSVGLE